MVWIVAALILLVLIVMIRLDFVYGREHLLKSSINRTYPIRKSDLSLFIDGTDLYADLFDEIRRSTHSVHVLFYIMRNDEESREFLYLLKQKAAEGVKVRLLLDYVGSFTLKRKYISQLKESGVQFQFAHKPRLPFFFYTLQARNHRKITVIDGKIGYLGGFNIGKEYLGKDPKLGYWRDYHLKVTGEAASDLQDLFLKDWFHAVGTENTIANHPLYFPSLEEGSSKVRVVPTFAHHLEALFLSFIKEAKSEIHICTPYFIPSHTLHEALITALRKGISVKIMVPMRSDHPGVKEASFPYYEKLLEEGCEIYRYYYGFYHGKVMVIDDSFCDIGTANFDKHSLYLNAEVNLLIFDREFIRSVKATIFEDINRSERLTLEFYHKRSLLERLKERAAAAISHFL
ncbi:cardiolipin synthase [Bacillus lacus]|uniref:Cardiolipin synthase n=1 Tax=Metabacillus lacus TaxID=1983721 RepID=A0A7X2IWW8_9BACI|nr:cardiolipin synthase [Metabacillus lacus]MRX71109.1 cardiolipin synthase [Metabacillus lacus]